MWLIYGALIAWTIVSVAFYMADMGSQEDGNDEWYVYVLSIPVLVIICTFYLIDMIFKGLARLLS